ncbi:MAG: glycosyltransferase family 4 protein [Chitinophagaceae bacterium]|nr:glycosyltransferase family 4 protein [Chitinophagaceae bacterium]
MIIAVNTRLNKETQPEGYEEFLFSLLHHLTKNFPQHQFIYIFDTPFKNILFQKNVTPVVAGPKASSNLRLQYWFNYRIPAILRKYNADVFVSLEGICSLRTKVPQCLLLSDLSFLNYPELLKKSQAGFYRKFTSAFLAKAKSIATVSAFSKSLLASRYKINAEEIAVIKPAIDANFTPIDWEEKELVKEKYAEGKAYFLFSGNSSQRSNLINLLKAFTFFKKRQKSNMMLLIAGNADEAFKKELKTYKLRNEVKLLEGLDKAGLAKITAAAYAMVYPVFYDDMALAALQALQCNVPLVMSDSGSLPAVFGEAALYVNPESFEDIAQKMMLVFKDEDKAKELVKAGNELLLQHQPGKNADLLMECILKAANS